jgi:hypothetical protein
MDEHLLSEVFHTALRRFLIQERQSLEMNVAERSLAARLSCELELESVRQGLKGYYADVEYNRKQNGLVKTMINDDFQVITINPDIILHSRGTVIADDNLITIEMKKSDRPDHEKISDRERLQLMTRDSYDGIWNADGNTHPEHVCGYKRGYYLELNIPDRTVLLDEYRSGAFFRTQRFLF